MVDKDAPVREIPSTTPEEWRGLALMLQAVVAGMLLCSAGSLLLPSGDQVPITAIGWFLLVFAFILIGVGMIVSFLPITKSPSR